MEKKTIGMIVMGVAGVVAAVTLVLLVKWHPVHIGVLVVAVGTGFAGYTIYKKG